MGRQRVREVGNAGCPVTRVFISYASAERQLAERLVNGLERLDLPCWIAPRDIPLGMDFQKSLYDAIAGCDLMLLLVSSGSNKSPDVARELAIARGQDKPVVPVRMQDVKLEAALAYQVSNAQWIDLFRDFDANLTLLSRQIAKRLQLSEEVAAKQARLRRRRRLTQWATGAVVASVLALGAFWLPRLPIGPHAAAEPTRDAAVAQAAFVAPPPVSQPPVAPSSAAPSSVAPSSVAPSPSTRAAAVAAAAAIDPLHRFVGDYYSEMSEPNDAVIGYLGSVVAQPVRFYGKTIDRRRLLDDQQAYLRRWPERRFVVRPTSVQTNCDASGGSCSISGVLDYDVRDPATDQAHWGTERFEMQVLRFGGGALQLTGISGSAVERHSGSAAARPEFAP